MQEVVPKSSVIDSPGPSKDSLLARLSGISKRKGHSSLGYRQQAESLMAQLKQDMKGSKRIFSTDATESSPSVDDASKFTRPITGPSPPHHIQTQRSFPPIVQGSDSPKISLMVASS